MSSLPIVTPIPAPLAPGYSQVTQAAALASLSQRLGDPARVYWSVAELRQYLAESLRTWQALTAWYRGRAQFAVTPNTTWYDLSASLTPALLSYNITDTSVASLISYHLLEAQIANGAWAGTEQFSLTQIQTALQNRLNRFLGDSGIVSTYTMQQTGNAPPISRVLLPPSTIDIRRLAWISSDTGQYSVLWRENEWSIQAFLHSDLSADPPLAFANSATSPAVIRLAPAAAVNGLLELVSIASGPTLDLTGNGVLLSIPDDFAWGVKFGALADLLASDGESQDLDRSAYCEQRYQESVQLASIYPGVLHVRFADQAMWTSSVFDLDAFKSGWQNLPAGMPQDIGFIGRNLLALSPAPTSPMYYTVDVVQNMPIPVLDTDYLQLPPDVIPVLLDYAQHLASFKMGGAEFAATTPLRLKLYTEASQYNERLRQMNFYNDAMRSLSQTEQVEVPRIAAPVLSIINAV